MGYEFTLTLNRKITDDESSALMTAGCEGASVTIVPYPTGADPDLIVTQLDFDDKDSETLEAAITVGLEAVKIVPDLFVATFSAPAQPNGMPPDEDDDWADLDAPPAGDNAPVVEYTVVDEDSRADTAEPSAENEQQESNEQQENVAQVAQ
jgi:hypothetical protein